MTIHLPDELERPVREEVLSGQFETEDAMVAQAVREYLSRRPGGADEAPEIDPAAPEPLKPIWEVAAELREGVPAEGWSKMPEDGAAQLDHFLYGSPKRQP